MACKNIEKFDIFFFMYIPSLYLFFFSSLAIIIAVSNMFVNIYISTAVSLIILIILIIALRSYVGAKLRCFQRVDEYYVVDDPAIPGWKGNAGVVLVPGLSAIVVSRKLISELGSDEVNAVVQHEVGHVLYRHTEFALSYMLITATTIAYLARMLMPIAFIYALVAVFILIVVLLVVSIRLVVRRLEVEADTYAVMRGFGDSLKKALRVLARPKGLLSSFFDTHPPTSSRPVVAPVDSVGWHVKVLHVPLILLSLLFTMGVALRLSEAHVSTALLPVVLVSSFLVSLLFLVVLAYVVLIMHRALGIPYWESRVLLLNYLLATLFPFLLNFNIFGLVASVFFALFVPPLLLYRTLRNYLKSLIPFVLVTIINVVFALAYFLIMHSLFQ